MSKRDLVIADVEIFSNYFLLALKDVRNGKTIAFEKGVGRNYDRQEMYDILQKYCIVTFNGINFDMPIIAMAIAGKSVFEMKVAADRIILGNMRPWIFERSFGVTIPKFDHIDLIEVAPLKASLKTYNGRLHGQRMQDLPYDPHEALSEVEMDIVKDYCFNDLAATETLLNACMESIELREQMGKDYGLELRSKSDAQVAEAVIKAELERELGIKLKNDSVDFPDRFKYQIPDWMKFESEQLRGILEHLRTYEFEVDTHKGSVKFPDFLTDPVLIGEGAYRMGIGGLHSSEERVHYKSCDRYELVDRDVASYYPNLILTQRLFPKQFGEAFLKVYQKLVTERLTMKRKATTTKERIKELEKMLVEVDRNEIKLLKTQHITYKNSADGRKVSVNGVFGKLGSIYSLLYAPDLMIQVTLSGQLYLLMLIERVEAAGFRVCSANTDGFVTLVDRERTGEFDEIVKKWEILTRLETEAVPYRAIYMQNVNNYIAIKDDGTSKGKGAFLNALEDTDNPDYRTMMQKNPDCIICVEAATQHLLTGAPVERIVRDCQDVRKFICVRNVTGGGVYDGDYLGKAVRWYYGHTSAGSITYKKNGNKVPKSEGCVPLMELTDELPHDLDYDYYIREANELLVDLSHFNVVDKTNWYFQYIKTETKPVPKSRRKPNA